MAITVQLLENGKVDIPKALLERLGWSPGTRVMVEDTPEGVLITTAPKEKNTTSAATVEAGNSDCGERRQ
ncbi:MAG: AbrB/MazE/SpoVT family DNA-binding domain-containing protein [Roseiarcus sp.]